MHKERIPTMKNVTSILRGCCPKAILGIAVFTACTAFTSNASAQCSNMMAPKPYVAWLNELAAAPKPSHSLGTVKALAGSADPSIVGLWKVNYLAGGQVVNQAFEVFHDDGTELSVD